MGDAPSSGFINIISEKAYITLKDIFDKYTTLYPVQLMDVPEEPFYMVVCHNLQDCLDREKSSGKPSKKYAGEFVVLEEWVFDEECIAGHDMFVLPNKPVGIYVSEYFKQRVVEAGLKGFCFKRYFWEEKPFIS